MIPKKLKGIAMTFSFLEECHTNWQDILVIGKTIEKDGLSYHIVGMSLTDGQEANLYIIEPYIEPEIMRKGGINNQRKTLKESGICSVCRYLNCKTFSFGDEKLQVQSGSGGPIKYSADDYGMIQLFFEMINSGWTAPEWLKDTDWDSLQLVTLTAYGRDKLPIYTPGMPITITHSPDAVQHIVEKTVTLHVGKSRSFSFLDAEGDTVYCYINDVTLIDMWKDTEERFRDPQLTERFSPEQLEAAKKESFLALEQNCPKGMCYIGIEYECSKDFSLVFYSKEFLKSRPKVSQGSASFFLMHLKPDKKTGTHGLPLKGCAIQTPVTPDTETIPGELFSYYEQFPEWTETI